MATAAPAQLSGLANQLLRRPPNLAHERLYRPRTPKQLSLYRPLLVFVGSVAAEGVSNRRPAL